MEGRVEIGLLSRKTPVPRKQLRNGLAMNLAERWRLQTSSCDILALGRRIGIERIMLEDSISVLLTSGCFRGLAFPHVRYCIPTFLV